MRGMRGIHCMRWLSAKLPLWSALDLLKPTYPSRGIIMQPRAAASGSRLSGARRTATSFDLVAARWDVVSSHTYHTWGADSNQPHAVA